MIRPLSDKSRRPHPIRGLTQRHPKPQASTPIGMHEPTMEAEPVLDPTIGSYSPVFGSTLPESFGEGITVFGGLSMSPVRKLDVFSQISRSTIPIDPFTGATPEDIMQEAARPQTKQPRQRGHSNRRRVVRRNMATRNTPPRCSPPAWTVLPAGESLTGLGMEDLATPATEQVLSGLTSAPETPRETPDAGIRSLRADQAQGASAAHRCRHARTGPRGGGADGLSRHEEAPPLVEHALADSRHADDHGRGIGRDLHVDARALAGLRRDALSEFEGPQPHAAGTVHRAGGYMQNPPQSEILMQARGERRDDGGGGHKFPSGSSPTRCPSPKSWMLPTW